MTSILKHFTGIRILILLLAAGIPAAAQTDTIRIVQYNLLNYGASSNPVAYKDLRLSAIISHIQPDIFGANEISNNPVNAQNILTTVLGAQWTKGNYVNTNNEIQTNTLFWRADKFALKEQKVVSHNLRDIIAYRLYYKDASLNITHDTVFLTIIVAHLKAGDDPDNESDRQQETQSVVNYLNNLGTGGNYFFMGDLNVYSSSEPCYSQLTNNSNMQARLYDPINRPGDWNSNSTFADIHTQSTRTTSLPDGGITGGLDDRFDQILVSGFVMNNAAHVQYLPGSYKTLGQDGNHHNKAVNAAPVNNAAPPAVIQALYEMSDHLPVYADFIIDPPQSPTNTVADASPFELDMAISNPFRDRLNIYFKHSGTYKKKRYTLKLYTAMGKQILTKEINHASAFEQVVIDVAGIGTPGLYILTIGDDTGRTKVIRLIRE